MAHNDAALLQILAEHLNVTERLLETVIPVVNAARVHPDFALPALEDHPTLQEMLATTHLLRQRVESIVRPI